MAADGVPVHGEQDPQCLVAREAETSGARRRTGAARVHGDGGTDTDSGGGEGEPGVLREHEQRVSVESPVESLWRHGGGRCGLSTARSSSS